MSLILLVTVTILSLVGASHFAFALVNWIAALRVKPSPLPRMNYVKSIPAVNRTLVVVPTLITSSHQIEKLIEDLEIRFLSNRDPNLHFALLTDYKDASAQNMPGDEQLVQQVKNQIQQLNVKYGSPEKSIFLLFHRPRQWNASEKIWMGYERKRGKLTELNHVLRGATPERFFVIVGDKETYTGVKYVITLDAAKQVTVDFTSVNLFLPIVTQR